MWLKIYVDYMLVVFKGIRGMRFWRLMIWVFGNLMNVILWNIEVVLLSMGIVIGIKFFVGSYGDC